MELGISSSTGWPDGVPNDYVVAVTFGDGQVTPDGVATVRQLD